MKVLLVATVWVVAILCLLLAIFSAWLGRADWGGGDAAIMSVPEAVLLVVLAALSPAIAWWLTRRHRR